jgi:hypothetical protein
MKLVVVGTCLDRTVGARGDRSVEFDVVVVSGCHTGDHIVVQAPDRSSAAVGTAVVVADGDTLARMTVVGGRAGSDYEAEASGGLDAAAFDFERAVTPWGLWAVSWVVHQS